ncbi:hypothetical protein BR93DRAFT_825101 [Coniochaeta sp. PMI_546]|nr:hypothetical protein BR93DRAFT_825101 [Coniochaeta sp. PMI_546]
MNLAFVSLQLTASRYSGVVAQGLVPIQWNLVNCLIVLLFAVLEAVEKDGHVSHPGVVNPRTSLRASRLSQDRGPDIKAHIRPWTWMSLMAVRLFLL